MYAVIKLQWHQYIVNKWDTIVVDKMEWEKWKKLDIDTVLVVFDEKWEKVEVWSPYVKWAKVSAEILETRKWEKISVLKFKRKTRYKRTIWFRPHETVLQIKDVKFNG
jgi:large subunit ribosomal protein L21